MTPSASRCRTRSVVADALRLTRRPSSLMEMRASCWSWPTIAQSTSSRFTSINRPYRENHGETSVLPGEFGSWRRGRRYSLPAMHLGVNVPNYGPGTDPGVLREWARLVEGLGFDLLMVSDHVAITPDVAVRYPEPFFEPFTTPSWLAGITTRVRLGTTVLVLPYRHPLLGALMAKNLDELSCGRLVVGVGAGGARQEFEARGVPFNKRGLLTDQ